MAVKKGKAKPKVTIPMTEQDYKKFKQLNINKGVPSGYTKESYWQMMDFLFLKGQLMVTYTVEDN